MTAISTQFIVFSGLFLTLYIVFTVHYICFVLFVSRKMSKRERGGVLVRLSMVWFLSLILLMLIVVVLFQFCRRLCAFSDETLFFGTLYRLWWFCAGTMDAWKWYTVPGTC